MHPVSNIRMCIKVVERYLVCRCIYYSHAVDACPAYGRRGHSIKIQEVKVGYTCSRHTRNRHSDGLTGRTGNVSISQEDPGIGKALDKREECVKETTANTAVDSPMRGRLMEKLQQVLGTDEQYLPVSDLDDILTSQAINEEMKSLGLEDPSSFVSRRAKKTFAILLVIGKLDGLRDFIKEGYGDEVLPISNSAIDSVEDGKPGLPFSNWDSYTRDRFLEFQWTLLAPVFSEGEHLKLEFDVRLPFVETEPIAKGAYGGVHRVKIHSDHETFDGPRSPTQQKGNVYALKQFTRGTAEVNERAFNRERDIMKSIRSPTHGHIIKLLATFEHRGQYSIILPLADENLRQFWAHATPSLDKSLWCLQQMAGIAAALSCLHNDLLTQDLRSMRGYHMDIKPENILIETDASSTNRDWKLSDFGSSYLLPKESRQELPPHPGLGTYEPPECQLGLPQSQAYDIWSLGCIFLECTAWSLKGSGAIDAFAEDRLNDVEVSGNIFKDDYFFTVELDTSFTPLRATTRPAVLRWIEDLERDPKCSEAIGELLNLIKTGLLQADQSKRLKARHLSKRLELIHENARQSSGKSAWTILGAKCQVPSRLKINKTPFEKEKEHPVPDIYEIASSKESTEKS